MIINDPVYGMQEINDPICLEIMDTPEMQRLKGVNQYGVWNLFDPQYFTSRFEHCVGVYLLLRKLGASKEEQLAGLIHDISHTAFSHVIDYVFDEASSQTTHERFKEKILFQSSIPKILKKYGFDIQMISNEHHFSLLEREAPNLCADRVDYFLRDGLLIGVLSKKEAGEILQNLTIQNNEIGATKQEIARMMVRKFLQMGEQLWSPPIQSGSYRLMAEVIKKALNKRLITEKDFFLNDQQLLEKLQADRESEEQIRLISFKHIKESTANDYTFHTTAKARYIDPKIFVNGVMKRTSEIYPELTQEIMKFKEKREKGYYIKIE